MFKRTEIINIILNFASLSYQEAFEVTFKDVISKHFSPGLLEGAQMKTSGTQ